MRLVVEHSSEHAYEIGLTREQIETMARSKLRAAKIYSDDSLGQYLHVGVHVGSADFSIIVRFLKWVLDIQISESRGDRIGPAITWVAGGTGTHGQDANFILQSLSKDIDWFINEYLRVNEESC